MKKILAAIAASLLSVSAAMAQTMPAPTVAARSFLLLDATSGQVLASQEPDLRIEPASLTRLLTRIHRDYPGTPLMITENGAAYPDVVEADGSVDDLDRQQYFEGHVDACREAVRRGLPLRGYFAWSLLDNYEWAFGYTKRFGIVYVDYETQVRTVKASGRWFAKQLLG